LLRIKVHPRINEKRPDISDEDVIVAWINHLIIRRRYVEELSQLRVIGIDGKGRFLQMVAAEKEDGILLIYHAMKLTNRFAKELDL